jgi:hypothetical protein
LIAIVGIVAGASLVACGSDDDDESSATAGNPLDSTCVRQCIEDNPDAWKKAIDDMATCVCKDTVCGAQCVSTWCKETIDYNGPPECGNCALSKAQQDCMAEMGTCIGDAACSPVLLCLMACQSGG